MTRALCITLLVMLTSPASGFTVTPSDARSTSSFGVSVNVHNLIDGSGLIDENNTPGNEVDDVHDNNSQAFTMWHAGCLPGQITTANADCGTDLHSPPRVADQRLEFDLNGTLSLTGAYIWQMNQGDSGSGSLAGQRGVNEMEIWVSAESDGSGYEFLQSIQLNAASGIGNEAAQFIAFDNPLTASRVRFDILSAHSGSEFEHVGLSEVRFEAVPEPTPLLLAALGLIPLWSRRSRIELL